MKRFIFCIVIFAIIINFQNRSIATNEESKISQDTIIKNQKETLNIDKFISEAHKYTEDIFEDVNYNDILNSAIKGKIDNRILLNNIFKIIGKESLISIRTIASIIVVIIIHSVLKSISSGLENEGIAKISYYVQYILIVTLIMSNFADIITMLKETLTNLVSFSNMLIPILITLIITTGNVISANVIQPILLFVITFMGNFILNVILPVLLASTALSIVSKISDYAQLNKLSKFFKSGTVWILGTILTLFVSLVSIEGNLSSSVDGVTAKTAKAVVSSFIPVVGKILGDATDTVIGCASILKNAIGAIGVIVIIGICIRPIIRLVLIMTTYYIGSAICEPLADEKIIDLLSQMGDTFKVMLAILCSMSVILIIGTTLVIKISNSGLMYR